MLNTALTSNLNDLYTTSIDRIKQSNNVNEYRRILNEFITGVCTNIRSFCLDDEFANNIKYLFSLKDDTSFQIPVINLEFAIDQYEKYLDGMGSYISTKRPDDEKINSLLDKDTSFVQSLFDFGNASNNETIYKPVSTLCTYCNFLSETIDKCSQMLTNLTNTSGDKLIAHSLINVKYYKISSIYKMIDSAIDTIKSTKEVSFSSNSQPDIPEYQVF